ncbi:MAG: TonB-dependent receptor plug domain-containing protein, partial [bacterium]
MALQGNTNSVAATTSGSNVAGVSGVSLRGLGSQRTLVLINGRRISGGGTITDSVTVDVNSIPLAAVERVEVLKDGASAIYGSDAIAGVINFILRQDYHGSEVSVFYGDTKNGGGSSKRVVGAAGFGDLGKDRYNVMFVGSYQKDEALFGRDRNFASSSINVGANNDTTSGNTFPANISARDGSFGTRNPLAPDNCAPSVVSPLFPQTRCRFDPAPFVTLLPATERGSIYSAAHFEVSPTLEAYAEASYARNRQHYVIQPSPISNQFAIPPSHPLFNVAPYNGFAAIVLQSTSPYYPTACVQSLTGGPTPDLNVFYRAFGLGLRDFTDTSDQPRGVI